jgi:hypothetical protein
MNNKRKMKKKNPSPKRAGRVSQGVGPEFKNKYCQKQMNYRINNWESGDNSKLCFNYSFK